MILDERSFLAFVSSNGSTHQTPGTTSNTLGLIPCTSNDVGSTLFATASCNDSNSNIERISICAPDGSRGSNTTRYPSAPCPRNTGTESNW
ncbi:MAG: Uncharacterised protein [Marine Group II euryarchaeote MED-G33]|nr:MAG: Uncharacterised protein [Marine Group II euryarchaeote MED-G33]